MIENKATYQGWSAGLVEESLDCHFNFFSGGRRGALFHTGKQDRKARYGIVFKVQLNQIVIVLVRTKLARAEPDRVTVPHQVAQDTVVFAYDGRFGLSRQAQWSTAERACGEREALDV